MSIPLSCSCGKKFAVKDEHAGKKIKCPECGAVLTVPTVETPAEEKSPAAPAKDTKPLPRPTLPAKDSPKPPGATPKKAGETLHDVPSPVAATIPLSCDCGKKLAVKSEHAGKKIKCPACQKVLEVPNPAAVKEAPKPSSPAPLPAAKEPPKAPAPSPTPKKAADTVHDIPSPVAATIPLSCECGKKFAVKSEHAGKKIKCPACQKILTVPTPTSSSFPEPATKPAPAAAKESTEKAPATPKKAAETLHDVPSPVAATISVTCECGKKLAVKREHAGKKIKCPGCQKLLAIPVPEEPGDSAKETPAAPAAKEPPSKEAGESAPAAAESRVDSSLDFGSFTSQRPRGDKTAEGEEESTEPDADAGSEKKSAAGRPGRGQQNKVVLYVALGAGALALLLIPVLWLIFGGEDPPSAPPVRAPNVTGKGTPTPAKGTPPAKSKPPEKANPDKGNPPENGKPAAPLEEEPAGKEKKAGAE